MLIDWFTVGAQLLNFVVLVLLLRHFLYKPILIAVDAREKKIADELANAAAKEAEAEKAGDDLKKKNDELDQERAALMSKATDEAKAEGQRLIDEARHAADAAALKRSEALRTDASALHQAITRKTKQEVFAISRKVLSDLASTSLEARAADVFGRRLQGMQGAEKDGLAAALKTARPALVRSAFELAADERASIQRAINETFSADVPLRFEAAPDLVSGIELTANGLKVGWSIADYLTSLERTVDDLLGGKASASKSEPGARVVDQPNRSLDRTGG